MLVIRPETLGLTDRSGGDDSVNGIAVAARFAGTHVAVDVLLAGGSFITVHAPVTTSVSLGASVAVVVPRSAGVVLAAD